MNIYIYIYTEFDQILSGAFLSLYSVSILALLFGVILNTKADKLSCFVYLLLQPQLNKLFSPVFTLDLSVVVLYSRIRQKMDHLLCTWIQASLIIF